MDNYLVSARKYRPVTFDQVVGQEHITTTLKNAIKNNKLAQALLFCGPRGVGKTTCARILASMINNFETKQQDTVLNIFELDAASNNSVDDIRNLIDQVRYPPQHGKFKVYIIDEVHMLSTQAFNAFLKTLEEPPPYAIFILATTEKHKIIPTIISRCQIYDFKRIQIGEIIESLKKVAQEENISYEMEALHLIAEKADGGLRDALSLFDLISTFSSNKSVTYQETIENLHILNNEYYFKIVDYLFNENLSSTLLIFDEIIKKGFDEHNFLIGLCEHFRELLVSKNEETIKLLEVSDETKSKYLRQSKEVSISFILSSINILNTCELSFKKSKNQRLHVEIALIKVCFLNSAINLKYVEEDNISSEKKKS